MSFITQTLTPIIQVAFLIGVGGWILWLIYKFLKWFFSNFWLFVKYKVFNKKVSEEWVEWCFKTKRLGWDKDQVRAYLLIKGVAEGEIREIMYIYNQIEKDQKGGEEDEQVGSSNKQDQIPEI